MNTGLKVGELYGYNIYATPRGCYLDADEEWLRSLHPITQKEIFNEIDRLNKLIEEK